MAIRIATNPVARERASIFAARTGVLLLWLLTGCTESVGPSGQVPEGRALVVRYAEASGEIDGGEEIHAVTADGSETVNLTHHPSRYRDLRLSPGGGRVAFSSDRGGCYDVWTMGVEGSGLTQLTGVEGFERCNYAPRWSADGSRIAFYSSRNVGAGRGWDAYVIRPDGTGLVYVGDNPSTELATNTDLVHGWSPDGRVVIHSTRDGVEGTYLADADGSGSVRLFPEMDGFLQPHWSPSGDRVAILLEEDGNADIWVVGPAGSEGIDVTSHPGGDYFPQVDQPWSPDGEWLAFVSSRSGDLDVWVVGADGGGLHNATNRPGADAFWGWTEDGRMLVSNLLDRGAELYLVSRDGSDEVTITVDPDVRIRSAVWVPGTR